MIDIETQQISIEHRGNVRGGANASARLHIHITSEDVNTNDEAKAIFEKWNEEFGLTGSNWAGWWYPISSRREFALLPAIIRKAQLCGFDVAVSQWDTGVKGKVSLSADPCDFWREIALAQMWFEK